MSRTVAIITRTKNRPLLLPRCIESVLQQTHRDWVHVIINDGGDAAKVEKITSKYSERYGGRLCLLHNPVSVGMQNASNQAIHASASEFIAIHDDDDSWSPLFLTESVTYLERAGATSTDQGVATQTHWIIEEFDAEGKIVELERRDFMPFEAVNFFNSAANNPFPPIAFLYRRAVHEQIGYFDQAFDVLGDHDFNLRFLARYDIGTIAKRLANYHWRKNADGDYGNTVTTGLAQHKAMRVRMQNHYLRRDLAEQKMGVGFLMNMSASFDAQKTAVNGVAKSFKQAGQRLERYEKILLRILGLLKYRPLPLRFLDHGWDLGARTLATTNGVNGDALQAALRGLDTAKVLSLDVFDTTLLRLVRKPTDVFLHMQAEVREILQQPELNFVALRVKAETEARDELRQKTGGSEVTLEQIYFELGRAAGGGESARRKLLELELQTERRLCYAHPQIVSLLKESPKNGRTTVFASDMYLSSEQIVGFLEKNGINGLPVMVSSELGTSKHEGSFFDQLTERLQASPKHFLHIGDNEHSDFQQPRRKGLAAVHWTKSAGQMPLVDQLNQSEPDWGDDLASSLYTGLVRKNRLSHPLCHCEAEAFWKMIGYEVIGPLYHAFVKWVIERAQSRGIQKLFFLARDGYHLMPVFEAFQAQRKLSLEATYLYASRRLLNLARIERLDEVALEFLATPNPGMRVRDFGQRIGINLVEMSSLAANVGFDDLEMIITTKHGGFSTDQARQKIWRWLRSLEGKILELAKNEREILLNYLNEAGVFAADTAIVDIGWQASSLVSINQLAQAAGRKSGINGFYFGTWEFARPALERGCSLESFFVHLGLPKHRASLLTEGVEVIESFFSAPHGSITGLEKKNGQWEPHYGPAETSAEMQNHLKIATVAAHQFVQDALAIWPHSQVIAPGFCYLETVLERLLVHPQRDEALALGQFSARNSFGNAGPVRHLAKLPSMAQCIWNAKALQEAYDLCYWRKGFLAQLGKRGRNYVKP